MKRLLTGLLVLAAIGVLVIVVFSLLGGDDDGEPDIREVQSDERGLSVKEAIGRAPEDTFAVRGFAYDDGAFIQLCNGLTDDSPPRCVGPSVLLLDLDLQRLPLERGEIDGRRVLYTEEPVLLGGNLDGTQLRVVDVLIDAEG
ncbi:MAG TPA: hypothetical protein VFU93_05405 [Acidimicrobiales bacterium]|nr:hypothetical protein [Acidimicrobiales bacterium]